MRRITEFPSLALILLGGLLVAPDPASASCPPPGLESEITTVGRAPGLDSPVLHIVDPNPPAQVSGFNVYRSSSPASASQSWSLLAFDATDEDASAPGVQWTDDSGDASPTGIWYYRVAPLNAPCDAEGPRSPSPGGDEDGDGLADRLDPCPTTLPGTAALLPGCSMTDLLLYPEPLVRPTVVGVEDFLARNADQDPPAQAMALLSTVPNEMTSAYSSLRFTDPCGAAFNFGRAVTAMTVSLGVLEDHLETLAPHAAEAELGAGDEGTEGHIDWPSPEYLYWAGEHFGLGLLTAVAVDARRVVDQVCAARGETVTVGGRIRSVSDRLRAIELHEGGRVVMPRNAPVFGGGSVTRDSQVSMSAVDYGGAYVASFYSTILNGVPFVPGLGFDGCLELKLLPLQPLPGQPFVQSGWEVHEFAGYLEGASVHGLERGMLLLAEDGGCPGVLPGAGPAGQDVRLDYFYEIRISYAPLQGGFVSAEVLAQEMSGATGAIHLPAMSNSVNATLVAEKYKRTCLESALVQPIHDPISGNIVGFLPLWDCSAEQLLDTTTYTLRVRDAQSYCTAGYLDTTFAIEDDDASDWRPTEVDTVSTDPSVPGPVTFSAVGDRVVAGVPTHGATVGEDEPFAVYGWFGNAHTGLGTDNASGLDWPHVSGTRPGGPFRYACSVPRIVTDEINACFPPAHYRMPFPENVDSTVGQGNGGGFSHNGWQWFALDLSGSEGDSIRAARGGRVIRVRSDMDQNCIDETCTDFGFPLLDEYGNHVAIQHQDGTVGWYAHMVPGSPAVLVGQQVRRGQHLGSMGNTGNSTGPHLHFHVTPEDPNTWGNMTVQAWYEAVILPDDVLQTCTIPAEDETYRSTNAP